MDLPFHHVFRYIYLVDLPLPRSMVFLFCYNFFFPRLCFQFHRQNSWSILLADNVYKPIRTIPYRNNAFKCHSFLAPGQPFELARLKTAVTALTRYFCLSFTYATKKLSLFYLHSFFFGCFLQFHMHACILCLITCLSPVISYFCFLK